MCRSARGLPAASAPAVAAAATARALAAGRPHALLHIGIAGAQTLEPPALVLGSEAVYADARDPQSTFPRIERVEPDQALLALARRVLTEAHVLSIATSARVGGGGVCEVEAMEGFGVLRAAALAGVPALELRAVSNSVGEANRKFWRIDDALAMLAANIPRLIVAFDA